MRCILLAVLAAAHLAAASSLPPITQYVSNADRSMLLQKQTLSLPWNSNTPALEDNAVLIHVNADQRMQTIDGFGFALTGGTAQLLMKMQAPARHTLLRQIFGNDPEDAHVSYLRVSIGASDMNDHVYTYDDLAKGATDPDLLHFSLAPDEQDVIPILQQILSIQPHIHLLASPWTAPSWMKSNELPKGGTLRPEDYQVYAHYLVRYLQTMKVKGIPIEAITPQNEPLNPKNTPSMVLEPEQEEAFIRDALGPVLRAAGLATKIVVFDHNCDRPDYPETILKDPEAAKFVDGSGFHLYEGTIDALSGVHEAFPAKNIYFTEQMTVEQTRDGRQEPIAGPVARVMIGATRNWSRNVLLWNLAADPQFGPHTADGGCPVCQGAITLDGNAVTRNIAYYTVAQISRFVAPGSVRIGSDELDPKLANVAFRTPGGRTVLVLTNLDDHRRAVRIEAGRQGVTVSIDAGSAVTYVW